MRRSTALLTLALVIAVGLLASRVWFAPRPPLPALLTPTHTLLNFGDVYVGTAVPASAMPRWVNSGGVAITVQGVGVAGPNAAGFAWRTNPPNGPFGAVAPGGSTPALMVFFTPTAEGPHTAVATPQAAPGGGAVIPMGLAGNGRYQIQSGDLVFLGGGNLDPGSALDFGRVRVGTPAPGATKRFRVTNLSANALRITGIDFVAVERAFTLAAPTLPHVLNGSQSVMVAIDFTPPAFTQPPNQKKFTDGVTVNAETVTDAAQKHRFGTALCGVGYYPADEPERRC
ncbi:MAG: hypothetical protein A3G44_04305 [Candidatus Rokubacteria bacterium RIFCSPLOWO2_12_FULL_73_47]|nr:MAG: hypothetical protein A3G44_04305 [Candidatus Rokubacteria bacterium RIFCSPLOWO2_12_FULL_73_47]